MCSSMCRELGFSGDWRSQVNQVMLLPVLMRQQFVELVAMRVWLSGSIKAR